MAMEQTPELFRYSRSPNYNAYHDLSDPAGQEAFRRLTKAEAKFMVPQSYFNDERNQRLRRSAVAFMETHSRSSVKFDALIPYMAMTYYDRFVAEEEIPTEFETDLQEFNLFLTSCLSIAWKLRTKTFNLLHFLEVRNLEYSAERVLKTELLILKRLKWRMKTPTSFSFVEYFIPLLDLSPNKSPRRPVRQLIVKSQFDIAFTEYTPSVLATSALLIVTSRMFPEHEHNMLERRISGLGYFIPLKEMLLKCKKELVPLYNAEIAIAIDEATPPDQTKPTDPMVTPGEASGQFTRRTNPITMPGRNLTRLETPFQPTSKAIYLTGFAAKRSYALNKEIETRRSVEDRMDDSTEGEESDFDDQELTINRHPGKEPVASHEVVHDHGEITNRSSVEEMSMDEKAEGEESAYDDQEEIMNRSSGKEPTASHEVVHDHGKITNRCSVEDTSMGEKTDEEEFAINDKEEIANRCPGKEPIASHDVVHDQAEIINRRAVEDSMDARTEGEEFSNDDQGAEITDPCPGKDPSVSLDEVVPGQGESINRRPGKEPAANPTDEEIKAEETKAMLEIANRPPRKSLAEMFGPGDVEADDELMDFDLGWIELQSQADARKRDVVIPAAGNYGANFARKLTDCIRGVIQGCTIL